MNAKPFTSAIKLLTLAIASLASSASFANTTLDFENPLPGGLVAQSFQQGAPISVSQQVTDQYLDQGVVISGATVAAMGLGHTASGVNGLSPVNGSNQVDYASPVSFTFFLPSDGTKAALTDFFSYAPDLAGGSGNIITLSAYDLLGSLVGQNQYVETGVFGPGNLPTLSGIGQFHLVTIQQTLFNQYSGGIGIDLVQYGDLTAAPSAVPLPAALPLMTSGLGLLGFAARRRKNTAV
jgi:hypothetical protein